MFLRSTELQLESIEENNCGVRKVNELIDDKSAPKRIIGRENVRPNESHPWQVSILIFSNQFKQIKLFSGGALLNQKFIITAAHCVHLFATGEEEQLIIKFGTNSWKDESAETRIASLVILHPEWIKKENKNDIALVMFDGPIEYKTDFNGNYIINKICLPPVNQKPKGLATLTGFGHLSHQHKDLRETLQKVDLEIVPFEKCKQIYSKKLTIIDDMMICAGGQGQCLGDLGEPLSQLINGKMTVVGIVSFGPNKCCVTKFPVGFTQVSKYVEWILDNSMVD